MTCPPPGDWGGRLAPDTSYGSLAIGGVAMLTTAWTIPSLALLYDDSDVRGDDRLLPGAIGIKPMRRRATATRHSLPLLVTGYVTGSDVVVAAPYAQLGVNLRYLRTNVSRPTNIGDGTRTAVLTLPDGTVITQNIHVLGMHGDLLPGALWSGTLELSDPTGAFHA